MKTKLQNRLSVKLIVSISLILICILAVYTYILITNLDEYLTKNSFKHAFNISDLIKKSTRYSMLLNRREDVHQIINTIGKEEDVKGIRIYNKQGTIIFSTNSAEINKRVDVTAEACIGCHNSSTPLKTLSNQNKSRIFSVKGNRILGLINPINNEKDCYSADCHAHSPKIQFLGVLDVMVSLNQLDAIKAETTKTTIINSAVITLVIAAACGVFIIVLVNIPMGKLSKGMEELGNGNLDYRISVDSNDELGKMAKRFNEMSSKLKAAYESIKEWSDTLNEKVNEKTEELKNIYSQVNQIEKLASLGKLSATVAHELNNPLEGILTYSRLISRKLQGIDSNGNHKHLIEYLQLISEESARCGKIVKDLLLFSHTGDDEFSGHNLISIIDKSVTLIGHHLEINKIDLTKEYCSENILIFCNAQKIQQALISLFINSIEAMPRAGKIRVKVDISENNVSIRIIDEGTGIAGKDLPHIFEPFYSTKEASKGTGLGLAVVYGIVSHHNGNVKVEKTSGQGTTFLLTLPLNLKG
jgi:two-component system NtrC family sensor kinase